MFGVGSPIPWREIRMPLVARSATLPVPRAALIAGNESGRGSVTHRANHVALPSMVQRDQRNHFAPPVLTGYCPSVHNGWSVQATPAFTIYTILFGNNCQ